jgi:hypothetical protein
MAMAMGTLFEALGVDKPFRARKEGFDTAEAVQQIQSRLDVQGDEVTETVADDGSSGEGLGDDTDDSTGESDDPFDAVPDE